MAYNNRLYTEMFGADIADEDGLLNPSALQNVNAIARLLKLPQWPAPWEWNDENGDMTMPAFQYWTRLLRRAGLPQYPWWQPYGFRPLRFEPLGAPQPLPSPLDSLRFSGGGYTGAKGRSAVSATALV